MVNKRYQYTKWTDEEEALFNAGKFDQLKRSKGAIDRKIRRNASVAKSTRKKNGQLCVCLFMLLCLFMTIILSVYFIYCQFGSILSNKLINFLDFFSHFCNV